ncbi:patatin-like phospholipase family protein [Cytophagaceae bacterium DM2B3-1]|uniref:Patatin-like phospholipase family protein n=1 Tax=Xanthocytophaga flava TaxID=3048013 RepID=A0ABT7CQU9_9BACT|nr:patatin-like phospholipase family protein [Xanthocytophaga flavus]MDJ1495039.1 patatin-like phospholipase family protein [Xanthocytophaga flavus]
MNAIVDLTARAVSFITAIQTSLLRGAITLKGNKILKNDKNSILTIHPNDFESIFKAVIDSEKPEDLEEAESLREDSFTIRAAELVWVSKQKENELRAKEYAITLCVALHKWLWYNKDKGISELLDYHSAFPTPYNWRNTITQILYTYPKKRVSLAKALQYLPIQIVLAMGGGNYEAWEQRIFQMWRVRKTYTDMLLDTEEFTLLTNFKDQAERANEDPVIFLKYNDKLTAHLLKKQVPLSFEEVFTEELAEIEKNRDWRKNELQVTDSITNTKADKKVKKSPSEKDPFQKGRDMDLYALAFSGGGIRSATFNLGVLQGLANNNLLHKFDYLSTVSGGGYIGSWLAAWIKRDGSPIKVAKRLSTEKSPDPLGEELRPIRWLRMFSNYLAPRSSIMSADSWSMGIIWLRNTLLNQIIIFLLLLSLLFLGNFLFKLWDVDIIWKDISCLKVLIWSAVILIPISLLSGLGMHAYHQESIGLFGIRIQRKHTTTVSMIIIIIGVLVAYLLSAWLCSRYHIDDATCLVFTKINTLIPGMVVTFFALCLVAILGKYHQHIKSFGHCTFIACIALIFTALCAAIIGLLCLVAVWTILEYIEEIHVRHLIEYIKEIQFIIGVPLVIEAFSITVVARMALLGKYFPDERREWWGRMGAYIHRLSFLWILIATSALLGQVLFKELLQTTLTALGGWVAVIGFTVRAAFSSKSPDKENKTSPLSQFLNILSLTGPYLFAIGLLVFMPGVIAPICNFMFEVIQFITNKGWSIHVYYKYLEFLYLAALSLLTAYLLARQVGVNEFSMHHFYRNRLVRAYLGATRRGTDRQRTSNPFTGFDSLDDEKLYTMTDKYDYHGPYLILNSAINASQVTDLDRQDRMAESFIFSPLYCGFDFSMIRSSADRKTKSYDYAFRKTKDYAYKNGGPTLGTAMATSGAAVNPNQGYHSSAATAFLMTVFNVQLGRWIGNPRKKTWQCGDPKFGLGYIVYNLINKTNTRNDFISLSDGGHFDNMGLYEMVRRKCTFIVVCDAEQDDDFTCEGFANAIRRCRIDFGAEIDIDISKITERSEGRFSAASYALGKITYANTETTGQLLYIKSSIKYTDWPVDVREYALKNKTFPHQSTGDQFFDEEQFESYRKLGFHLANIAVNDPKVRETFKF